MSVQEVLEQALALPPDEQERLLAALVEQAAASTPDDVTEAWDERIRARIADVDAGRVVLDDWDGAPLVSDGDER